jgi:hypothetical protein
MDPARSRKLLMDHPLLAPAVLPITIDAVAKAHADLEQQMREAHDDFSLRTWAKLSHVDHLYRALTLGEEYMMTKRTVKLMERIAEEAGL